MRLFLFFFLFVYTLLGYSQTSQSKIIGTWVMESVVQSGNDVTSEHNPKSNRYISFLKNGTFESGGDPYGINTGKYSFDNSGSLFLDSDTGLEDDSIWSISFEGDLMIWKGLGSEFARNFVLKHRKAN